MVQYILYLLICGLFLLFLPFVCIKNKRQCWTILLGFIVVNAVIASARSYDMPDTMVYKNTYESCLYIIHSFKPHSLREIFFNRQNNSIEIGFIYLMYIVRICGFDFRFFLGIISFLTSVIFMRGMELIFESLCGDNEAKQKQLPKMVLTSWFIYIYLEGILYTSVALRSGLSMAIGVFFLGSVLTKRHNIFTQIICLIIAILIHSTGITWGIIFLLWIFLPKLLNRTRFLVIWGLLFVGYYLNFAKYTINTILGVIRSLLSFLGISAFSSYFISLEFIVQKREMFIILFVGFVCALVYSDKIESDKMALLVLIGFSAFTFAYPIQAVSREADYFITFAIPLIVIGELNKNKYISLAINILTLLFVVPQYIMIWGV